MLNRLVFGNPGGLYFEITYDEGLDEWEVYNECGDLLFNDTSREECIRFVDRITNKEGIMSNDPDAVMKLAHNAATGGYHFDEPMLGCPTCEQEN